MKPGLTPPSYAASGFPIVVSAPSGGGKSTVAEQILKEQPLCVRSISCTTRAPRKGETNGKDYFFLSIDEFKKRIAANAFIEWAEVHGNLYGTLRAEIEKELQSGHDVLLTIDPQGAESLRKIYPHGVFIFLVPPTWDLLLERLNTRGTDDNSIKDIRIANAKKELQTLALYDYLVVNDELDVAVTDVTAIIRAEHRRTFRVNKNDIPILC
jgi:guanylate kinase